MTKLGIELTRHCLTLNMKLCDFLNLFDISKNEVAAISFFMAGVFPDSF